jgi:WD40 repeat protein
MTRRFTIFFSPQKWFKSLLVLALCSFSLHSKIELSSNLSSITQHSKTRSLINLYPSLLDLVPQDDVDLTRVLSDSQQDDLLNANSHALLRLQSWMDTRIGTTAELDPQLKLGSPLDGQDGINKTFVLDNFTNQINWHPSGTHLLVSAVNSGKNIHIYSFDSEKNRFSLVTDFAAVIGTNALSAKWSPGGKNIAGAIHATNGAGAEATCMSFDGDRITELEGCRFEVNGSTRDVAWSPGGQFFAPTGGDTYSYILNFDGATFADTGAISSAVHSRSGVWSPDGKYFAIGGVNGSDKPVIVYSWENGQLNFLDEYTLTSCWNCQSISWSPDGKYLAASPYTGSTALIIFKFDGSKLSLIRSVLDVESPGFTSAESFDWSADGKYLFVGFKTDSENWTSGILKVFSINNDSAEELKYLEKSLSGGAATVNVHPNLPIVATMSNGTPQVQFWQFDDTGREKLTEIEGCNKWTGSKSLRRASWSSDGRYVSLVGLSTVAGDGSACWVYEFSNGTLTERARFNHGSNLLDTSWHPSGKYLLISGNDDGGGINVKVLKFDGNNLTNITDCEIDVGTSYSAKWHPSGNYLGLLSLEDTLIKCYKFENESVSLAGTYNHGAGLYSLDWHPSGAVFAVGGDASGGADVRVIKFNKTDGSTLGELDNFLHGAEVDNVKWSADGKYLGIVGKLNSGDSTYMRVLSFDGISFTEITTARFNHGAGLDGFDWIDGSNYIAVAGFSGTGTTKTRLFTFDGTNLTELVGGRTNLAETNYYYCEVSPDEKHILLSAYATGASGYGLRILPIENGKSLQFRRAASEVAQISFDIDVESSKTEIASNSNATISLKHDYLKDVTGYKNLSWTTSNLHMDVSVNALDWSKDGKHLILGMDNTVGGSQIQIFKHDGDQLNKVVSGGWDLGISATVKDVAWHPGGDFVAVAADVKSSLKEASGAVSQVKIFELTTTGLNEFNNNYRPSSGISGNIETVEALDWSPDGKFLIAAGYGPTTQARIYGFDHKHTLSELASVAIDFGNSSTVYDVAWHPSGNHIALGGGVGESGSRIRIHTFENDQNSLDGYLTWTCTNGIYDACQTRYGLSWSADGTKLAAVGGAGLGGAEVLAFDFYPTTSLLSHLPLCDFTHGGTVASAMWSNDSKHLSLTGYTGSTGVHSRILKFETNKFSEVSSAQIKSDSGVPIRYGDVVTLKHSQTSKFLSTSWKTWWQAGLNKDDATDYRKQLFGVGSESVSTKWIVKGPHDGAERWNCRFGQPVKHDDVIRFESIINHSNIHSTIIENGPISTIAGGYGKAESSSVISTQGVLNVGDDWVIKIDGNPSGGIWKSGQTVRLNSSNESAYWLISHDVDFQTENGAGDWVQEIPTYNTTISNDNTKWTASSVDSGGYRDVIDGGLRGGAGRAISYSPDSLTLSFGGGLDNRGASAFVKPLNFQSLKSYTKTTSQTLGDLVVANSMALDRLGDIDVAQGGIDSLVKATSSAIVKYNTAGLDVANSWAIKNLEESLIADSRVMFKNNLAVSEAVGLGEELSVPIFPTVGGWIRNGAWSPDGKYFAATIQSESTNNFQIYKKNGSAVTKVASFDHGASLNSVKWHPKGKYVAVSGYAGSGSSIIRIFKFEDGALTQVGSSTFGATAWEIDWNKDGDWIAFGDGNGDVNIATFDFDTQTLGTFVTAGASGHSQLRALAWRPDGKFISVAGYTINGDNVRVFSVDLVSSSTPTISLVAGHAVGGTDLGHSCVWTFDGSKLIVVGNGGSFRGVKALEFNDSTGLESLSEVGSFSTTVVGTGSRARISSDDKLIAMTVSGIHDKLWLLRLNYDGTISEILGAKKYIAAYQSAVEFSPDVTTLVVGGGSTEVPTLRFYPIIRESVVLNNSWSAKGFSDGSATTQTLMTNNSWAIAAMNNRVATAESNSATNSNSLLALNFPSFENRLDIAEVLAVENLSAITENELLEKANSNLLVNLDSLEKANSSAIVDQITWEPDTISGLMDSLTGLPSINKRRGASWSPNGNYLALVGDDGVLRVYSFDGSTVAEKDTASSASISRDVKWHPDGKHIAFCSGDLYVYSFVSDTLALEGSYSSGKSTHSADWSADGTQLLVGEISSGGVLLFEFNPTTSTLTTPPTIMVGTGSVSAVKFSPDNDYFVTGAWGDGTGVRVYSFNSGVPSATLLDVVDTGAPLMVDLIWWPDGSKFAVGCQSGSANLRVYSFDGSDSSLVDSDSSIDVLGLALTSDASTLFTGGGASTGNIKTYKVGSTGSLSEIASKTQASGGGTDAIALNNSQKVIFVGGRSSTNSENFKIYPFEYRESLILNNSYSAKSLSEKPSLRVANSHALVDTNNNNFSAKLAADSSAIVLHSGEFSNIKNNSWALKSLETRAVPTANSTALVSLDSREKADSNSIVDQFSKLFPGGYGSMSLLEANSNAVVNLAEKGIANSNAILNHSWSISRISGIMEPLTGTPEPNTRVWDLKWNFDGRFCAVASQGTTNQLKIYRYKDDVFSLVAQAEHGTSVALYSLDWHPDGKHLATGGAAGNGSSTVVVYSLDGNSLAVEGSHANGTSVDNVKWSPDGNFLLTTADSNDIYAYSFNSDTSILTTPPVSVATPTANALDLEWSPNGQFFAAGLVGNGTGAVYSFNSGVPSATLIDSVNLSCTHVRQASWWPDGSKIAFACQGPSDDGIKIYEFSSNTLSFIQKIDTATATNGLAITRDGKNVVSCGFSTTVGNILFYHADSSGYLTEDNSQRKIQGTTNYVYRVGFNPSENILVAVGTDSVLAEEFKAYPMIRESLLVTNSNTLVELDQRSTADSNAVVAKFGEVFPDGYSQPSFIENNSTAVLNFYTRQAANSVAIVSLDEKETENSSALLASSEVLFSAEGDLINANSNAAVMLNTKLNANSSAIKKVFDDVFPNGYDQISLVEANSNVSYATSWAVKQVEARVGTANTNISSNDTDISALDTRIIANTTTISTQDGQLTAIESDETVISGMFSSIDSADSDFWFDNSTTLSFDIYLYEDHKIHATSDLSINAAGHVIGFPGTQTAVFELENGVDVTITNALISRFSESNVNRQGSNTLTFGDGTRVTLASDENLSSIWKFSGNVTLDGKDHRLDLSSGGRLEVASGGTLTLRNIKLNGVLNDNLSCADDNASIKFKDVDLEVDKVFHFGLGSFDVGSKLRCHGAGIFSYESTQASTILGGGLFEFAPLTTFSYSPTNTFDNRLIFTDSTSKLLLDGATLKVTATGFQIHTGTLVLKNKNYLEADQPQGQELWSGFRIGNELEYQNMFVDVNPGGSLEIKSGLMDYMNVESVLNDISVIGTASNTSAVTDSLGVAWSKDDKFIATGAASGAGDEVKIYSFDGSAFSLIDGSEIGSTSNSLDWHKNNENIITCDDGLLVRSYKFDGTSLSLTSSGGIPSGSPQDVDFSHDGKFIALSCGNLVYTYSYDASAYNGGIGTNPVAAADHGGTIYKHSWSPDGKYILIGGVFGTGGDDSRVYKFENNSLTLKTACNKTLTGQTRAVTWNSYGNFVALGGSGQIDISRFDKKTENYVWNMPSFSLGSADAIDLKWSEDGRYLFVALDNVADNLRVYHFDGKSLTLISSKTTGVADQGIVSISNEQDFIATAGFSVGTVKCFAVDRA